MSSFVTDGAWKVDTGYGAAAWVQLHGAGQEVASHVMLCNASLVAMVEI